MTIARSEVPRILASCVKDQAQAEKIREWYEKSKQANPNAPGLDDATATLLFAAAMGDTESWKALTAMHPAPSDLDANDMPAVLDRLFTRDLL